MTGNNRGLKWAMRQPLGSYGRRRRKGWATTSIMSLARATPSMSKRARSAPKIRSALSVLLGQSSGSRRVAALISRRFSSAAVVRSEASHNHAATMRTNAPTSAAALKRPRPTHVVMTTVLYLTFGERCCEGVQFGGNGVYAAHAARRAGFYRKPGRSSPQPVCERSWSLSLSLSVSFDLCSVSFVTISAGVVGRGGVPC